MRKRVKIFGSVLIAFFISAMFFSLFKRTSAAESKIALDFLHQQYEEKSQEIKNLEASLLVEQRKKEQLSATTEAYRTSVSLLLQAQAEILSEKEKLLADEAISEEQKSLFLQQLAEQLLDCEQSLDAQESSLIEAEVSEKTQNFYCEKKKLIFESRTAKLWYGMFSKLLMFSELESQAVVYNTYQEYLTLQKKVYEIKNRFGLGSAEELLSVEAELIQTQAEAERGREQSLLLSKMIHSETGYDAEQVVYQGIYSDGFLLSKVQTEFLSRNETYQQLLYSLSIYRDYWNALPKTETIKCDYAEAVCVETQGKAELLRTQIENYAADLYSEYYSCTRSVQAKEKLCQVKWEKYKQEQKKLSIGRATRLSVLESELAYEKENLILKQKQIRRDQLSFLLSYGTLGFED